MKKNKQCLHVCDECDSKGIRKGWYYRDLLSEWEEKNRYKTITARSALKRFTSWLDSKAGELF